MAVVIASGDLEYLFIDPTTGVEILIKTDTLASAVALQALIEAATAAEV